MKTTPLRAVLAACAVLAALTACTPDTDQPVPRPSRSTPACQDAVADGCQEIAVAGKKYRYYLSGPAGTAGAALLVDLGGPGVSLGAVLPPNYQETFRKDLGAVAGDKPLLLIEEPWVSADADAACTDSAGRFYSWMRQNWARPAAGAVPPVQCPWDQGTYGWNRSIDDLVTRATLVRPAAAPGTPGAEVTAARTAQVWKSLTARCEGCTAADVADVAARTVTGSAEATLPTRSVPVTGFDVASALVAAGISTNDEPDLAWKAKTGTVDMTAAATLSDALWLRIGEESVSPGLIAYMDEYCQAYPADPTPATRDPVRTILAAPIRCAPDRLRVVRAGQPVDCLIIGSDDASAPAALARTWRVAETGTTVTSRVRQHWFTGLDACGKKAR